MRVPHYRMQAIEALQALDSVRVIVLCAQGAHFTAGIDLGFLTGEIKDTFSKHKEPSRRRDAVVANIQFLQVGEMCSDAVQHASHLFSQYCAPR